MLNRSISIIYNDVKNNVAHITIFQWSNMPDIEYYVIVVVKFECNMPTVCVIIHVNMRR